MIQVFRSVPVASSTRTVAELPPEALSRQQHTITLGWENRLKTRARRVSDQGFEFATVLSRGAVLREGDCFVFDSPPVVVRVAELAEPVFVIKPQSPGEWALFGYHIGNCHQPLMFGDDAIICPDVTGMESVLEYHRIPFVRAVRPFTPVGVGADHRHQVAR